MFIIQNTSNYSYIPTHHFHTITTTTPAVTQEELPPLKVKTQQVDNKIQSASSECFRSASPSSDIVPGSVASSEEYESSQYSEMQDENIPYSNGCASAKDRTGYVDGLIAAAHMTNIARRTGELVKKKGFERDLQELRDSMVSRKSLAGKIIQSNTPGVRCMKIADLEASALGISLSRKAKFYVALAKDLPAMMKPQKA